MRRLSRATVLLTLCLCAGLSRLAAQQPAQQPPTFRSGVALVTIDVTVLDEQGRPVPGLTASDIDIKLDGKLQPIRAFAFVQATAPAATPSAPVATPVAAAAADAGLPGDARRTISNAAVAAVETPEAAAGAQPAPAESRVFVLVIDDLSFAPSRGKAMWTAAQRFLDRIPASDPVGFTTTTGIGAINPTRDRAAVRTALTKVVGQFDDPRGMFKTGPSGRARFGSSDSPLGVSESIDIDRGDESLLKEVIVRECFSVDRTVFNGVSLAQMLIRSDPCPSTVQREARRIAALMRLNKGRQIEGVRSVINAMKTAGGIRHIVLLSEGLPVSREISDLHPLVRTAAEAGVQLSVLMEEPDISVTDDARGESMGSKLQNDIGQSRRRREDDMLLVNGLQTMTDMLGGTFYRVVGTPDPFFDRVLVASSAVYRLGVELPAGAKPGDVFDVVASVRRPGLTARANRFTVAAAPVAPEPVAATSPATPTAVPAAPAIDDVLKAALNKNVQAGAVPMRIAAFVRRSPVESMVDVTIDIVIPPSVQGPVTSYFGLVDPAGKIGSTRRVLDAPGPSGFSTSFTTRVAPGDYRVRFAAADASRALGTIELPVSAVLASAAGFAVSDVLTWYVDAASKAQLFAIEDVPAGIEVLRASLELYPNAPAAADPPTVRWTLSREDGEVVKAEERKAQAGPAILRADVEFPWAELRAGRYIIRAEVMADGKPAVSNAAVVKK